MKIKAFSIFLLITIALFNLLLFARVNAQDKPSDWTSIPKLPVTTDDPELENGKVYPAWGPVCMRYTYSVYYKDKEGREPEYMRIWFNGEWYDMEKENPEDNNYKRGVKYVYKYVPNQLGVDRFYYFEASNGVGKDRACIIDSPCNGPVLFESGFEHNEIALVDSSKGVKIWSFPTGEEWVGGIAISDDGKYLAAQTSRRIYFFETSSATPKWSYEAAGTISIGGDVKGGIDISQDGSKIFAAIGTQAYLFSRESNEPVWETALADSAYNVGISADGGYMAAATAGEANSSDKNMLMFWSKDSSKPLWQYHASGNFHDVTLSGDGNYIAAATGCPDRKVYLFSKDSGEPVWQSEMLTQDSPIHRARISSSGSYVAVGAESTDGAVFLFSKDSSTPIWKFDTPIYTNSDNKTFRAVDITPDGEYIGAASFGGEAYIFRRESNSPVSSWTIQRDNGTFVPMGAVGIATDGSFLAVGATDSKLHIYDRDYDNQALEVGFDEYVAEIDVSGDNKYIAAGTGASVYFFETIYPEGEEVECAEILEAEPEQSTYLSGSKEGDETDLYEDSEDQQGFSSWFIISGVLSLASVFGLIGYLTFIRIKRIPFNKLILILLLIIAIVAGGVFVYGYIVCTKDKGESIDLEEEKNEGKEDIDSEAKPDGRWISGDGVCEDYDGETSENSPEDCE